MTAPRHGERVIRPASDSRYDVVSLGEVMLRLDPGERRVRTARQFQVSEGGGEYNVARGVSTCFGLRAGVVTGLVDNEVGHLLAELIRAGGVDTSFVHWTAFDGIGRQARNALNFTERGFGVRGAVGVSDRAHTATGQLRPKDVDWADLFGAHGVRWLHTGGIYSALSAQTAETAQAAIEEARAAGSWVSFDLNYRPSLWRAYGDTLALQAVNRRLVGLVDVVFGNENDFDLCLGIEPRPSDGKASPADRFRESVPALVENFPNLMAVATPVRRMVSASVNDWGAIAWSRASGFVEATERPAMEILDRVGGGDAFAAGLIYGLLELGDLGRAVEIGAAHGALTMTTPGDTSMASLDDVLALVGGRRTAANR